MNFDKFDKNFDTTGLKEDLAKADSGETSFDEVPVGIYEVSVEKMELTESKKGDPMVVVWFKILTGDHKNSLVFMNQVVNKGFCLHKANELLRSLDSGVEVKFDSFKQYGNMILDIAEAIDKQGLEYQLNYGESKGYKTFEIEQVFESGN